MVGLVVDGLDVDAADAGVVAVELEGELVVPVEVADLAGLEADVLGGAGGVGELGIADVDVEAALGGGVGLGRDFFEHEAAGFGPDGGGGGFVRSEDDGDAVAAFGEGGGEEEGLVAGAGVCCDGGSGVEVEAGSGFGVGGGCGEGGEAGFGCSADEFLRVGRRQESGERPRGWRRG